MTKQHYPPTCPDCGASLPHDNPMSLQFHENIVRRSNEKTSIDLIERIKTLEEKHKSQQGKIDFLEKAVFRLTNQLEHQIPRIDDIEDKIDWSKTGKI